MQLNLKVFREERGVSVDAVASFLNVSSRQVRRYESGDAQVSLENLIALASYYGVRVDDFIVDEIKYVDRNDVVSYQDLVDVGLDTKLAHGIIKGTYAKYKVGEAPQVHANQKVKYVWKMDMMTFAFDVYDKLKGL